MFPGAQNYYQQPQGSPYTSSYMGGGDPQQGNPQQQQQLQAKMQAMQQQGGWNPNASQMGGPQSTGGQVGPPPQDANQMALARQQMLTQQAIQQQPQQGGGGFLGALSHLPGLGFMANAPMPPGVRSLPGMGGQQPGQGQPAQGSAVGQWNSPQMQPGSPAYQQGVQAMQARPGMDQGQWAKAPQGQPGGFGGAAQAIGQQAGQMFGSNLQRPGPPQGQPPAGMDPQAQQNYQTWLQQRQQGGPPQRPQFGGQGGPPQGQPMQGYGGGMPRFSMPQQGPQGGSPQFGGMSPQIPQGMYGGGGWGGTFANMQPQPMQQMPLAQSSNIQASPQLQQQNPQLAQMISQM